MRLQPEQLAKHLEGDLDALYLISGEEPLQREETLDALRQAARRQHFEEREVFHVDGRFDWRGLDHFGDTLSLFATRRILELRIANKLDDAGRKALTAYAQRLPQDVVTFIVLAFRVDGAMARAKWFASIESCANHIAVWPIAASAMAGWVKDRARRRGVALDQDAISLLAERGEGNLLAAAQDIDRLALLYGNRSISVDDVITATADSARFSAFDLVDACFEGDAPRMLRILSALNEEGSSIPEVLGPLAWAMRSAAEVSEQMAAGLSFDAALSPRHGAWRAPQRRRILRSALTRHSPTRWARLLMRASQVDRRGKGDHGRANRGIRRGQRDAWNELENLGLALCGIGARTSGA